MGLTGEPGVCFFELNAGKCYRKKCTFSHNCKKCASDGCETISVRKFCRECFGKMEDKRFDNLVEFDDSKGDEYCLAVYERGQDARFFHVPEDFSEFTIAVDGFVTGFPSEFEEFSDVKRYRVTVVKVMRPKFNAWLVKRSLLAKKTVEEDGGENEIVREDA